MFIANNYDSYFNFFSIHTHTSIALPAPEVNLTAASVVTVGTSVSLECSLSVVPHLIAAPHAELLGPGGFVLASGTNLSLTHTLDPVRASNAGQYVCRAALDIESVDVSLTSQSAIHTLTVQSES